MARLILVRHGETEWNRTGRYQGHTDVELNATGLWQAEKLRGHLAGQRIDAVYSSDLKRALRTAKIIASEHGLVVIPCKELREINLGKLEGMTSDEIQHHYSGWGSASSNVNIPGGESLNQHASRIELFVSKVSKYSAKETILIVAHGGSLRLLVCLLLGIGIEHRHQIRFDSASLTIVEDYPDAVVLSLLNNTCHLEDYKA